MNLELVGYIYTSYIFYLFYFLGADSNKAATKSAAATFERWKSDVEGKEMVSEVFPVDVDNLFTLLFTNSKFFMDFQNARKSTGKGLKNVFGHIY